MFEEELDRNGMPMELKYVPVIESALNTHAVSKAGATGLWQMMYGTGKLMGLKIDTYVDERRDPLLATKAGIAYLKYLYDIYDDWLIAIGAYNCGPGNMNKAIRKAVVVMILLLGSVELSAERNKELYSDFYCSHLHFRIS